MTQSGAETATLLFLGLLIVGLAGVLWLGGKRALPPVDPLIVILAEDDQASQAIRAARRISSNLCVILSPDCSAAMAGKILEEMAWSGDSFRQWRKNTGETATGLVKNWSDVFRLTGTIHSNPDLPPERLEELFRDGRVVIRCRGKGWPSEVEAALARVRKKTLLAPDGKDALPIAEWNDPIKLGERLEEAAMGISRNGDKK